jgi:putative intracellular protease/amidase
MKSQLALLVLFACSAVYAESRATSADASHLKAPERGSIPVAFVLTEGAVMIDFAGPWEVFQDVMVTSHGNSMQDQHVFKPYIVSDAKQPLHVSGGMTITPDYTFDDAPTPKVVVIPAQEGSSPKMMAWLRKMSRQSDVVMSVCTGAYKLAEAGLLDGKPATTHHGSYVEFQHQFPKVKLQRDMRYVASDSVIYTSGGLSSGIDLALHIVDGYFGRGVAEATAREMEYEGMGWKGNGTSLVKYSAPTVVHTPADAYSAGAFGNWRGDLATNDGSFHIAVHLWPDAQGRTVGSVDSIDQDVFGAPIENARVGGTAVDFEIGSIHGRYSGTLDSKGSAIHGTWTQGDMVMTLNLLRTPTGPANSESKAP